MIYLINAQKAPGTVPEFPVVPPGLLHIKYFVDVGEIIADFIRDKER